MVEYRESEGERPRMARRPRIIRRTILLIGEGAREVNFLEYLKQPVLCSPEVSVQVRNAKGGSPGGIIQYANKQLSRKGHDRCLILMDCDREWPATKPKLQGTPTTYVGSTPCIEAMFLEMLNAPAGEGAGSTSCKRAFEDRLRDNEKQNAGWKVYERLFPPEKIEEMAKRSKQFSVLLKELRSLMQ